ncbi:diguanylate cyclase [Wenzhouxiangella sp. XN79A]|uniref:GGDEF domain-containing protein n=1 Tax=Wenzhouxiangella sp. XN79A TaxID=2724193 RepID=UPI00144AB5CD|nr:GGDEF domain-containing protein [Wenzhouxiangella sp. XN79A]NKI33686.1 diguanylate cyclase [Wenzhouxiangella sp. XN79A]
MPQFNVRFLPLLFAVATVPVTGQDGNDSLDTLLDRADALSVASSGEDVERLIGEIELRVASATPDQRDRFELIRIRHTARAGDLDGASDAIVALIGELERMDPDLAQRALNLATNVLVVNDRFDAGFRYFRRALNRAPSVADPRMRAGTYSVAAEFYDRIGETATALTYADQALALAREFDLGRTACIALERGGRALLNSGRTDEAEERFAAATRACIEAGERVFEGQARLGLGRALGAQQDPGADAELRNALAVFERAGFPEGVLETRTVLAERALIAGRPEAAKAVLDPIIDRLDAPGDRAARAAAWQVLAELAERDGNRRLALDRLQRAVALRRDRSRRERAMRIALLINEQDTEARAQELELLRDRNRALELESERRQQADLGLLYGGVGAVIAAALVIALLVQTARDRRRFQRMSERDGLTGLLNHTRFFQLAHQAFQRSQQLDRTFTIVITDIDLFKQINDQHGHLTGDAILRRTGACLREAFGEGALLGRLGGEEFGVALPNEGTDAAVARIEHLRALIRRDRPRDEPEFTLSFGVAERVREPDLDALYARADQALYDAKDSGRDRVVTVARLALGPARFTT